MNKSLMCGIACCLMASSITVEASVSIGAKFWYARIEGLSDAGLDFDASLLVGLTGSIDLGNSGLWVSGMVLAGTYEGSDDDFGFDIDLTTADTEVVVGYSANIFDIGVGFRFAKIDIEIEDFSDSWDHYGPMVYLAAGSTFGDNPIGWYLGGSVMFLDIADEGDGEHWNIEGGLFGSWKSISATLGYRMKQYFEDASDDVYFAGFTGSLSYRF